MKIAKYQLRISFFYVIFMISFNIFYCIFTQIPKMFPNSNHISISLDSYIIGIYFLYIQHSFFTHIVYTYSMLIAIPIYIKYKFMEHHIINKYDDILCMHYFLNHILPYILHKYYFNTYHNLDLVIMMKLYFNQMYYKLSIILHYQ